MNHQILIEQFHPTAAAWRMFHDKPDTDIFGLGEEDDVVACRDVSVVKERNAGNGPDGGRTQ